MSWQNLVSVDWLLPLIDLQNHLYSILTRILRIVFLRFPSRCRRSPCFCSSSWPISSSHEKFWHMSETCWLMPTLANPTLAILAVRLWPIPTLAKPTLAKQIWPTLAKPTSANLNWPTWAKPTLAQIGKKKNKMKKTKHGRTNTRRVGPRRVGAPKGEGPQISRFFPFPATVSLFLCLSGCLLVEFWWCLKWWGPEMCTFGVLGLSCEAPAGRSTLWNTKIGQSRFGHSRSRPRLAKVGQNIGQSRFVHSRFGQSLPWPTCFRSQTQFWFPLHIYLAGNRL